MKHLKLCVIVLGAILLILGACQKEPQPPELISPPDGAVFDTLPPAFTWSSELYAEGYVIEVAKDSFGGGGLIGSYEDIWHYVDDHTYTLTQEEFNNLDDTTYFWHVASFWTEEDETLYNWSEWRRFVIDKPEEPQGLDLDTTYFPFGLGYEWCYERHDSGHNLEEGITWDTTYIITIKVVDSLWVGDTLIFAQEGSDYPYQRIWQDSIEIWAPAVHAGGMRGVISLTNPTSSAPTGFRLYYVSDTLVIHTYDDSDPFKCNPKLLLEVVYQYDKRLKAIGTLSKVRCWSNPWILHETEDRLLYFYNFYNGKDTVYKAE